MASTGAASVSDKGTTSASDDPEISREIDLEAQKQVWFSNSTHSYFLTQIQEVVDDSSVKEEAILSPKPKSHRSLSLSRTRSAKSGKSGKSSKKQQNIVKEVYPETDLDKGLVGWEGQDDPTHPRSVFNVTCGARTLLIFC